MAELHAGADTTTPESNEAAFKALTSQFGAFIEVAVALREMYVSMREVGFSEREALRFLAEWLWAMPSSEESD